MARIDRSESTHDANNDTPLKTTYDGTDNASSWIGSSKNEYTYDVNNNMMLDARYLWDINLNVWIGLQKSEWSYDVNLNKIESRFFVWDTIASSWGIAQVNTGEYDYNGYASETIGLLNYLFLVIYTYDYMPDPVHIQPEFNICLFPGGVWSYDSVSIYTSTVQTTSVENIRTDNEIEKNMLYITDILGKSTKLLENKPLFYIYDDGTVEKK